MDDQVCPKCKTTKYRNPSLKLMVNVCGHTLCESCVELLFIKGMCKSNRRCFNLLDFTFCALLRFWILSRVQCATSSKQFPRSDVRGSNGRKGGGHSTAHSPRLQQKGDFYLLSFQVNVKF